MVELFGRKRSPSEIAARTGALAQIGGVELPRGVPYAYEIESDVPIVVQHSRLDTSGGYTLFTTVAYGV